MAIYKCKMCGGTIEFEKGDCKEELFYLPWQADEDSNVVCPECDFKFKISFGGDR